MRAKRSLSQNFLVDPNLQRKVVSALEARPEDGVLEIGPGHGELSRLLVGQVRSLVLVEKDERLAHDLTAELGNQPGVRVVVGDALELDLAALLPDAPYRVLSNLPYGIATPLLFRILDLRPGPVRIVITVQREVADRLVAAPGSKSYGALSVGVQARGEVRRAFAVGRLAFRPVPAVDSATVVIEPDPRALPAEAEHELRRLTRVAFQRRRKQMQKILRTAREYTLTHADLERVCAAAGFGPRARPEELSPSQFIRLAAELRPHVRPTAAAPERDETH